MKPLFALLLSLALFTSAPLEAQAPDASRLAPLELRRDSPGIPLKQLSPFTWQFWWEAHRAAWHAEILRERYRLRAASSPTLELARPRHAATHADLTREVIPALFEALKRDRGVCSARPPSLLLPSLEHRT